MSLSLWTTVAGQPERSLPTEPEGKLGSILAHGPPCSFLERQRSDSLVSSRATLQSEACESVLLSSALRIGRSFWGRPMLGV